MLRKSKNVMIFKMCGYKDSRFIGKESVSSTSFVPSRSSWEARQLGCWATHHRQRWSLQTEVCSILRRCEQPIEAVLGRFLLSCCLGLRYRPTPRSQRSSIPSRQPSTLVHQIRFCWRSVPCEGIGEHVQLGTEVQP